MSDAIRRAEVAVRERPQDARAHDTLFQAIRAVTDRPDAEARLAKVCADLPHAFMWFPCELSKRWLVHTEEWFSRILGGDER